MGTLALAYGSVPLYKMVSRGVYQFWAPILTMQLSI